MKTVFEKSLTMSGSGIMDRRAKVISDSARQESTRFIQELESQLNKLDKQELELESQLNKLDKQELDLNDFGPENTDSLRPASRDFDPEKWVRENNSIEEQRQIIKVKLDIARKFHAKYFSIDE